MTKIIHLISGPRNLSTALMYSFYNRVDAHAIDEPFYAHYLKRTGVQHPGRNEILTTMSSDLSHIWKNIETYSNKDILFVKNMAHHCRLLDWNQFLSFKNLILIRDPHQLIQSFSKVITKPTLSDIGIQDSIDIFDFLKKNEGEVAILDSGDLLKEPEQILRKLCKQWELPFDSNMLCWPKGEKAIDGIWAPYWYRNVHLSTGFKKQKTSEKYPLPKHLLPVYNNAVRIYERLSNHKLKL